MLIHSLNPLLGSLWELVQNPLAIHALHLIRNVMTMEKIKLISPLVSVFMEWVLYPILPAMAMAKMGIMVTGGIVDTMTATEN